MFGFIHWMSWLWGVRPTKSIFCSPIGFEIEPMHMNSPCCYSFKLGSKILGLNGQIIRSSWPNLVCGAGGTCLSRREGRECMPLKEQSRPLNPIWKICYPPQICTNKSGVKPFYAAIVYIKIVRVCLFRWLVTRITRHRPRFSPNPRKIAASMLPCLGTHSLNDQTHLISLSALFL